MKISLNFLARIGGMLMLAYIGARVGQGLSSPRPTPDELVATQLLTLAGAGLGLLTTHLWTIEPARRLVHYIRSISIVELTAMVFGALLGALFALLLSVPMSFLPAPLGQFLPVIVAGALAYLGGLVFVTRRKEIATLLESRRSSIAVPQQVLHSLHTSHRYLIDTSAIIDGRIAAVSELGFLEGTLLVPHFVLAELQSLADSSDEMRRSKGRRGLEMLNAMQKESATAVEIVDADVADVQEVDDKLVVLARQYECPIITNDYNLGRVAGLQGVKVLSLNQLTDAVRPPVLPGQDIEVIIRDVGREREQGISFLDDGTMIVVEDARQLVGHKVSAVVTRIYQTQTGRIVFAHLNNGIHTN